MSINDDEIDIVEMWREGKSPVFPFHLILKYELEERTRKNRENPEKVVRISRYEEKRDNYFQNVILKRKK